MSKRKHNKQKGVIEDIKGIPGLVECVFEHAIKETSAKMTYEGPKIPKDVWQQVLSFFNWTNSTMNSESQVRLFVNVRQNTWAAWAFPQEAKTGMTARELDSHPNTARDRERFKESEGWMYFGTVHHHCSASAFQSGGDTANERTQDGLHITIGNMKDKLLSIHARFCCSGIFWEDKVMDMSDFWDIGDALSNLPAHVIGLLPENSANRLARWQMCQPSDVEFPQAWKDNVIEIKAPPVQFTGNTPGQYRLPGSSGLFVESAYYQRVRECAKSIAGKINRNEISLDAFDKLCLVIDQDQEWSAILHECWVEKVELSDVEAYFDKLMSQAAIDDKTPPKQIGNGESLEPKAVYNADEGRWEHEGGLIGWDGWGH